MAVQHRSVAEEAARIGALLAVATDAVLFVDERGRVCDANPAAEDVLGFARDRLLGLDTADLLHPPEAGMAFRQSLAKRAGSQDAVRTEVVTVRRADGATFPASLASRATGEADPPLVVQLHDASPGRTPLERGAARQARQHLFAELEAEALSRFSADGTYLYSGEGKRRLTGHPVEHLVGRSAYDFFHPDDVPSIKAVHAELLSRSETLTNTFRFRHAEGHYVWLESTLRGIRDAGTGTFVEIQAATSSLTDRRQVERALRVAEERFGGAFEHAPIGMALVSLDERFLRVNRALCELTGYTEDELEERPLADLVGEPEAGAGCLPRADAAADEPIRRVEQRTRRRDGTRLWTRLTTSLVRGVDGAPLHGLLQVEDIAHEKEEREAFSAAVLNAMAAQTAVLDAAGVVVAANRSWEAEGGAPVGEDLLAKWRETGTELWPAADAVEAVIGGAPGPLRLDHPVGAVPERRWVSLTVVALEHDGRRGAVVSRTDVTQRKHTEAELELRALRDGLTGLANRALFLDHLGLALRRRDRRPGSVAVIFVDVDRFKLINDTQGHAAGDSILVGVASRLRQLTRPEDTVARLGGDEFAVLCASIRDEQHAGRLASRIVEGLAGARIGSGFSGVSIGVALAAGPDQEPEDLLRDADVAMYRAKERGRGRYEVFDAAMRRRILRRLEVEDGLRVAVAEGQLRLVYQPIVELADGRVAGAEALLRWRHPVLGELGPVDFIEIAEESGLIEPIGRWVLEEACREAMRWTAELGPDAPDLVAVNVSLRQMATLDDAVSAALARTGLPGSRLALELTERACVDRESETPATLDALRARGVTLMLDDFGTGYSSLALVRRLALDALKVDRSFVAAVPSGEDAPIVEAIASMARALGLELVAEGIETQEQLAWLRGMPCRFGQGYLLGRPLEADALRERLGAQAASG